MSQRLIAFETRSARSFDRTNRVSISYQAVGALVSAAEVLSIILNSIVGEAIYSSVAHRYGAPIEGTLGVGVLASLLYVSFGLAMGLYRLPALVKAGRNMARVLVACGLVVISLTSVLFLLKLGEDYSRGTWLAFAPCMAIGCCAVRAGSSAMIRSMLARQAIVGRRAFLIGEIDELKRIGAPYLLKRFGLQEVGRFAFDDTDEEGDSIDSQRIQQALDMARNARAREFVVAAKWDSAERLNAIEEGMRVSPLPVRLLPNHVFRSVINRHASSVECSLHLIDLQRAPMSLGELWIKRALDIVISTVAIVFLLPILLITAFAIKLDSPGPTIFRQRRNGFNQDQFVIYKFRTMTVLEDDESVVQARRGDKRVTRVGHFLRRTSIDELPQLFNVLRGDMALVGPRPHALAHDREYSALIGDYYRRHHVKPGITGWAQVHGLRGETAQTEQMRRRVGLDVWYINNWSMLLDVRIMLKTALTLLKHDVY